MCFDCAFVILLFRQDGCVINGFAHEYPQQEKQQLTKNLPSIFNEFIFGEPVKTIGTTFCIWTTGNEKWKTGQIENYNDSSEEMLNIFDGNPQTYIDWATEYYHENAIGTGIALEPVTEVYNGKTLTKKMVLSIVEELEDWKQLLDNKLAEVVGEIPSKGHPNHFGELISFQTQNTKLDFLFGVKEWIRPAGNLLPNKLIPEKIIDLEDKNEEEILKELQ